MIDYHPDRLPTDLEEWAFETARRGWEDSHDRLGPPMSVPAQSRVHSRLADLLMGETGLPSEQAEEWVTLARIDHFEGLVRFPAAESHERVADLRQDVANVCGFIGRCLVPTAARRYFFRSKSSD